MIIPCPSCGNHYDTDVYRECPAIHHVLRAEVADDVAPAKPCPKHYYGLSEPCTCQKAK
jgi:hypothetical protein